MTDINSIDREKSRSDEPIFDSNLKKRLIPSSVTKTLETHDGELTYTATAGYLDLFEENIGHEIAQEATVKARVFLTTYVAQNTSHESSDEGSASRPVIFLFNGGPGSSSAWLHLGLFGPRIVNPVEKDGTTPLAPPYHLRDNPNSPLAYADLVVIDAISTGYSRVVPNERENQYHDADADIEATAEIIRLWITQHRRWNSPLYIAGESYGVLRGSAVSARLAIRHGIYLNGLILISSPITTGRMGFEAGSILGYQAFFPTYAAVSHYHGHYRGRSLADVIAEAEEFTDTVLLQALHQGNRLRGDKRKQVVSRYAELTGLREEFVDRANLRITPPQFRAELLRTRGLVLGRNDGRFTGWDADPLASVPEVDPSEQVLHGAFAAGINSYLREELGYENDLSYELNTDRVLPWRIPQGFHRSPFNALPALSEALRTNRTLKVLYQVGHYDLCTPFWGAISDVALLEIPQELRHNIRLSEFDSGHMIYVDEASRIKESEDIRQFINESQHL
ncbi:MULTISPECIES: S10 family peptidase [Bifidobacterium]|uniref:Peptidase S10, serine carboxypeptidase n=2 Tax=Bifidobacterium TaxID=1678 RepID=A0A087CIY1_9BIFI|nr:hypothetical protein [Bifidobacterium psychraerophilum]KFI83231.1 peptidase S10, serine carboxypeptidase [Bifidobacterium psychraerophilum]PKA94289.1 carboxypeptidase C (cathepsin A) [Bifidobacterium psychraerophilum DSM 22366]